jgi:hypothetical protein
LEHNCKTLTLVTLGRRNTAAVERLPVTYIPPEKRENVDGVLAEYDGVTPRRKKTAAIERLPAAYSSPEERDNVDDVLAESDGVTPRGRKTAAMERFPAAYSSPEKREKADGVLAEHDETALLADDAINLTDKIQHLEILLNSERSKNQVNKEEMNDLRQQLKKLREELEETRRMYEDFETEMNTNVTFALPTEDDTKRIKDLEYEVQHLKDKNKELADQLASRERKMCEMSCERNALNKEREKITEAYKHILRGKMNINL